MCCISFYEGCSSQTGYRKVCQRGGATGNLILPGGTIGILILYGGTTGILIIHGGTTGILIPHEAGIGAEIGVPYKMVAGQDKGQVDKLEPGRMPRYDRQYHRPKR